jgi:hypothetical protein
VNLAHWQHCMCCFHACGVWQRDPTCENHEAHMMRDHEVFVNTCDDVRSTCIDWTPAVGRPVSLKAHCPRFHDVMPVLMTFLARGRSLQPSASSFYPHTGFRSPTNCICAYAKRPSTPKHMRCDGSSDTHVIVSTKEVCAAVISSVICTKPSVPCTRFC